MKKLLTFCLVVTMMLVVGAAKAALTWNFENAADYYVNGDTGTPPLNVSYLPVITEGVGAYVPARPWINSDDDAPYGSDWASVFAKINTKGLLRISQITGGGFTLSGMNHPDAVYGSLYLSPTGGSGSTVLILLSPMGRTGSDGSFVYTFNLDTHADYRTRVGGNWSAYDPARSGTFGDVVGMLSSSTDYAAFFGPQIGMSNTNGTTFTVSQIQLVPEPATMAILALGALMCRKFKKA